MNAWERCRAQIREKLGEDANPLHQHKEALEFLCQEIDKLQAKNEELQRSQDQLLASLNWIDDK